MMKHCLPGLSGYDTCIFLNEAGKVSEGPGSCFFMVKGGVLITPRLTDSVLESITRDTVLTIARDLGISVVERTVDRTELYTCDEVFLCGSAMGITPVLSIDKYLVESGRIGKITKQLYQIYSKTTSGEIEKYKNWLTPVY